MQKSCRTAALGNAIGADLMANFTRCMLRACTCIIFDSLKCYLASLSWFRDSQDGWLVWVVLQ